MGGSQTGTFLVFAGDGEERGGGIMDLEGQFPTLEQALAFTDRRRADWFHIVEVTGDQTKTWVDSEVSRG